MEDNVKIPEEQLHDLRQDIYAWIIANGYAANKEVEVPPKDYDEVKAKANKYNSLKGLMKDLLK